MRDRIARYTKSQRSQGLTEFAIIAPIILLLTFGIIDFGRALYIYVTLQQAANEGARVAVRASYYVDANGVPHNWPDNALVDAAVSGHAIAVILANPCPNGPIPNGGNPIGSAQKPPVDTGWIFITDPSAAGNQGTLGPPAIPNAPRGQLPYNPAPAGCLNAVAADGNQPLKVTIWYTFQPITPLIQQVVGNNFVITAYAVYRAEYY
jgi:TadE-like protein